MFNWMSLIVNRSLKTAVLTSPLKGRIAIATFLLGLFLAGLSSYVFAIDPSSHIDRALALSPNDGYGFLQLCTRAGDDRVARGPSKAQRMQRKIPPPAKAFDNLYFIGSHWTHAWALTTSAGIIIFDAMDNAWEAEHIIHAGLIELGLDPASIKYIIVSHGHWDHYGGAKYLQDFATAPDGTGARVVMSEIDWQMIEAKKPFKPRPGRSAPPPMDMSVSDGDQIVLGDTTVKIVATPGHTMGTISPIFSVYDGTAEHRVMLWGGSSFNFGSDKPQQLQAYIESTQRAKVLAREYGVDTLISNHALYDRAIDKLGLMSRNVDSGNLFVLGQQSVATTFDVIEACAKATLTKWQAEAQPLLTRIVNSSSELE